jgi:hypothetical protein
MMKMKKVSGLGAALGRGAAKASEPALPPGYPYYGHAPSPAAPAQAVMPMHPGVPHPAMPHPHAHAHMHGSHMGGYGHPGQMPRSIEGTFPPGVYDQTMVSPYAQPHMVPYMMPQQATGGQSISVAMNAPSPHLTTKEWAGRGILGALGNLVAWLPRLAGRMIEEIMRMFVGVFGKLMLIALVPCMLMIGVNLAMVAATYSTVEGGAADIVHKGRHALNGIGKGLTDDLPPEQVKKPADKAKDKARKDAERRARD